MNLLFAFRHEVRPARDHSPRWTPWLAAAAIAFCLTHSIPAQSDDFDDGDDQGWVRFNPLSILGIAPEFSFPDDPWGGKGYRMASPAPPVPDAGPARAFSYQTEVYADFYAAFDVIAWDNNLNQAFGLLFRAGNIGLGQTTGYVFNYNPQQAAGGRGQVQINVVTGEQDTGTIGAANLSLRPGRAYRFVLRTEGPQFTARVYDLEDLTQPITTFTANDATYSEGMVGLFNFYRGSAVTDAEAGRADTTFDNYYVAAEAPIQPALPGTSHPIAGMPQLLERTPLTRANFHPAAEGVRFTASTLSPTPIAADDIRLILNGRDVSGGLQVTGSAELREVSYTGLEANQVYDARIILADGNGRTTTNAWTFDTFSEAFFDSEAVQVIEAEDYNHAWGLHLDDPPPSGYDSAGFAVNSGLGYHELTGFQGVDYFDHSGAIGSGAIAAYRSSDFVGTQAGSTGSDAANLPNVNDTIRQKYAALDLPEYQVWRTEAEEWLNYTRTFRADEYHAYLRVSSRAEQPVHLDRVTGNPAEENQATEPLGTFHVPSTGMMINYRFVPLQDATGAQARLTLGGVETLRLTMGGPRQNVTQFTLALNYMVFVPAGAAPVTELLLESSPTVQGPYQPDAAAQVDPAARTITLGRPAATRFYRLRADTLASVESIQLLGDQVVLTFSLAD